MKTNNKEIRDKKVNSIVRIYFRTLGLLLLLTVVLINYRSGLLPYSAFTIANAMTHIDIEHLVSIGLVKDIVYFIFILLTIQFVWAFIITISYIPIRKTNKTPLQKELYWLLLVLTHFTLTIGLNSFLYPTSTTSYFREGIFSSTPLITLLTITLFIIFIVGLFHLKNIKTVTIAVALSSLLVSFPFISVETPRQSVLTKKPNIIIIGIDGLRPDHLHYEGAQFNYVPFINRILKKSQVYKDSYTPQGRTYVAWMSLLTGQYPKTNGARFNLAPPELIDKQLPLISKLKESGYQTIYAMDERRFNQIDESYGFDSTAGPKIGAADAIISNFADLPLINILLKHPYSKHILPYLYNNRGYGKAYSPISFNTEVLSKLDHNKPNFLAVHFCQLHWPYTSNNFIEHNPSEWNGNYNHFMYKSMLKKIDKQIELFYQQLELNGFLRNSIVYIISDHGEGFKLNEKDDFNALKNRPPMQSWGHGTNVLDQQQAKVLLAKIRYKNNEIVSEPAVIEGLFSLIDILPSIDQELKLNLPIAYDGFPLPAKTEAPNDRHLFVESSLSLSSLNASFIDEEKVVSETASIYEIRPSGKAVIKPEEYRTLIRRKQRSIYQGEHQLAMLPDSQLVLLNIEKKEVKIVGSAENNHIVDSLLLKLCQFYKTDYGFDEINRCDYDNNNKYPDNG